MEKETKENLIKVLKEGSQRQFRKIKKEDLIELFDEIWKDTRESKTSLLLEIEDLKLVVENQKSIIESHEKTEEIIKEYQELTQSLREKYETAKDEALSDRLTSEKLFKSNKTLRISLVISIIIEILIILIIV
jgi:hypothetical protein